MKYRERTLRIPMPLWERIEKLQKQVMRPGSVHPDMDMDAFLEYLLGSSVEAYERKAEKLAVKGRLVLTPDEALREP